MNGKEELPSLSDLLRTTESELAGDGSPEYRKLYLAINRIASHMESERGTMSRFMERVMRLEKIIMGDDNLPGLKMSVDLLNENMKRQSRYKWMIASSVIALLVIKIGELLLHK